MLRWGRLAPSSFAVGISSNPNPIALAFDGANMWVTDLDDSRVTKIRASDGAILGNFGATIDSNGNPASVVHNPLYIAFDGKRLWIANNSTNTVGRIRASDGALAGEFPVGAAPSGVAVGIGNGGTGVVWVTNTGDGSVSVLDASDGSAITGSPVAIGGEPHEVMYDGTFAWVSDAAGTRVVKLLGTQVVGSFNVGAGPRGMAFDGQNIWVANSIDNTVTELNRSGNLVKTYNVGRQPEGVAFDGANIWVTNSLDNNVTEFRASDGTALGTFPAGTNPFGIAFDGSFIWVANATTTVVSKF